MNDNLNQNQEQNPNPLEPQASQPQPLISSEGSSFPKPLLIATIVLIVLAGGYFAYAKYQNLWPWQQVIPRSTTPTDETAGWKIYRNEKYGFEVKYPSNWMLRDYGLSSGSRGEYKEFGFSDKPAEIEGPPDPVLLDVLLPGKNTTAFIRAREAADNLGGKITESNIGEVKVYQVTHDTGLVIYIDDHGAWQYTLNTPAFEGAGEKYFLIHKKILSTFKFTQ